MNETGTCLSETRCKAYGSETPNRAASTTHPLCDACLDVAGPDVRALIFDYLDLAQLHETTMSQALSEKTAVSPEPPMPLVAHIEELQAEIVHVTTTWETELRAAAGLTRGRRLPIPAWATTTSRPLPEIRLRPGAAVQRAVAVIHPRLRILALLPTTTVCPTGVEDDPADIAGWEAIHHLQALHGRARAALGRTKRTFWIPGDCWKCEARPVPGVDGPLWRSEPRRFEDPMQVGCQRCGTARPYSDYETYMATAGVRWPTLADLEPAAA